MEPGVVSRLAVTPSFPLDFVPTGQFGMLFTPTDLSNSGLIAARCLVNTKVVPLLSARTITLIGRSGSLTPGFALAISGSLHLVTLPSKIPAYASLGRRRFGTSFRL